MFKLDNKKQVFISLAILLLVLLGLFLLKSNTPRLSSPEYQQERLLRFSYEITNRGIAPINNAHFSSYFPIASMPYQSSGDIQTTNQFTIEEGAWGNRVAHFDLGFIPPYGKKIVKFVTTIKTAIQPNYLPNDKFDKYLIDEKYIEKNTQKIIDLAEKLKASSDIDTVKNIYDWASQNIKYTGYVAADKGALSAIETLSGDCTEYMYTVVALARALGIPARGIGGYVYPNNAIVSPNDYHNWAEVYFNRRWHIVDAQKKQLMPNNGDYIAMRILSDKSTSLLGSSHRFSIADDNLSVRMN